MSFTPLGKFIPRATPGPLAQQTQVALALEAGTAHVRKMNGVLATRVRLVSIRQGVVHAICTSAPAAAELRNMRESLFGALKTAYSGPLTDLRVEVRGSLEVES